MNEFIPVENRRISDNTTQSMSSREIADLTDKDHFHVMRDLRAMHDQLGALFGGSIQKWIHPQNGQAYDEYLLDKDTSLTLLLGYDALARMKVVKRWQELEAAQKPADLSRMEILQLAMDSEQARIEAEAQLALAAPKVVYADAMLNADGTVLVRDAAKTIGVPVRKLEKVLRDKGVILPGNGPAAKYVAQGYLVESLGHYETNTRGRQISRTTRVTGKGLEFLRRFAERHADILAAAPKKAAA